MTVNATGQDSAGSAAAASTPDPDTALGLEDYSAGKYAEALAAWRTAARNGDGEAALYLGTMYDQGLGVPQDFAEALHWYETAAERGNPIGAFNAGIMYDAGHGVDESPEEAAHWYALAARAGFGRAEYNLGMMYEDGDGVAKSRAKAIHYYRAAYRHGINAARTRLARLHARPGRQGHKARDEAMAAFDRAQDLMLRRSPGSASRAAVLFQRAAEKHNGLAAYDLGYCYDQGIGVAKDPVKALIWYRRAASEAKEDGVRKAASDGATRMAAALTASGQGAVVKSVPASP